jgi:hypothetical protein
MTAIKDIKTAIGLTIYKGDYEGAQWSITGNPNAEVIGHQFDGAYEFEDCIKRHVNCSGIEFDSEYCQFWAYAKTKARLVSFGKQIDKYFAKAKKVKDNLY